MTKQSASKDGEACPVFVVNYPAGYANAEMNGTRVVMLNAVAIGVVNALIIDGPKAGRRWQFIGKHLKEVANV